MKQKPFVMSNAEEPNSDGGIQMQKEVQELLQSEQKRLISLEADEHTRDLLRLHLSYFVPLRILELAQQNGICHRHIEELQAYNELIAYKGEAILFHVKGDTAHAIHALTECIAILAFLPGGVTFSGLHFEGKPTYGAEEEP